VEVLQLELGLAVVVARLVQGVMVVPVVKVLHQQTVVVVAVEQHSLLLVALVLLLVWVVLAAQ
jgi:hypothetical protein